MKKNAYIAHKEVSFEKKAKNLKSIYLAWLAVAKLTKNVGNVNECIYCHIVSLC